MIFQVNIYLRNSLTTQLRTIHSCQLLFLLYALCYENIGVVGFSYTNTTLGKVYHSTQSTLCWQGVALHETSTKLGKTNITNLLKYVQRVKTTICSTYLHYYEKHNLTKYNNRYKLSHTLKQLFHNLSTIYAEWNMIMNVRLSSTHEPRPHHRYWVMGVSSSVNIHIVHIRILYIYTLWCT